MDIIADEWMRRCIGIAVVIVSLSALVLSAAPLPWVLRQW